MALSVIVIFGRYFNLNGWSGKLAAGMLATAALLLVLAAVETIRQRIKGRRHAVDSSNDSPIPEDPDSDVGQERESTDLHHA